MPPGQEICYIIPEKQSRRKPHAPAAPAESVKNQPISPLDFFLLKYDADIRKSEHIMTRRSRLLDFPRSDVFAGSTAVRTGVAALSCPCFSLRPACPASSAGKHHTPLSLDRGLSSAMEGGPGFSRPKTAAMPGKTLAIVGPTGAGKTTIINLLMRFYDVNSGTIKIDGIDETDITRTSLRKAYTMVLQDTWLFHGTIFENIVYGKESATKEEVMAAAKAAKIDSYIEHLPLGYNTVLSDDGVNISKGQKQLITIARAMLSDAPMLILDEATSNVDSRTEIQIQQAMQTLMRGKTCFVIAHRLSTIKNADLIIVVQNGTINEQGTHEELLRKGGFYSTLYNSQFS